jgi:hypothetical protein
MELQPLLFQKLVLADGLVKTMRNLDRGVYLGFRQHHHEFISPVPGHDIHIPEAVDQNLRHLDQHLAPHEMSVPVVDELEIVHVEEDQRDMRPVALGAFEFGVESLVQVPEVKQLG